MTLHGLYYGNNTADLLSAQSWLGQTQEIIAAHTGRANWTDWSSSIVWKINQVKDLPSEVRWSIPLIANSGNLRDAAAHAYDSYYVTAAQKLAAAFAGDSQIIVRVGEEFNASWMPWAAAGKEVDYIQAYRNFVDAFRSVSNKFKFEWNVNDADAGSMNPATAYPGDNYVDIVGMDFYWFQSNGITDATQAFTHVRDEAYGLQWLENFAAAHGKPSAYSEWGVDTANGSDYVRLVRQWFDSHAPAYEVYFDSGGTEVSDGSLGDTSLAFQRYFGERLTTSATSVTLDNTHVDLTLTGTAAISGTGNDAYNTLTGNDGANVMRGLAGDDILIGGKGNDTLYGGTGNDTFVFAPGSGADTIADIVIGNAELDKIDVSAFRAAGYAATLTDIGADVRIAFGSGDSILVKNVHAGDLISTATGYNLGSRFFTQGPGEQANTALTMRVWASDALATAGDKDWYSINLTQGNDIRFALLAGGSGFGTLADGKISLYDAAGNYVAADNDSGSGADAYVRVTIPATGAYYVVVESATGAGTGTYQVGATYFNMGFANDANVVMGSAADDLLIGSTGNDTITGGAGNDTLLITPGGGRDTILDFGNGTDTVDWTRYRAAGLMPTFTASGNDTIVSFGNGDTIKLVGAFPIDITQGYSVFSWNGVHKIVTDISAATDTTLGFGQITLTLTGNAGAAGTGNELANTITGNDGANVLNAMAGNDMLIGGKGDDTLTGGTGSDTFRFALGSGKDVITDFAANGDADHIDISAYLANGTRPTLTNVGNDVRIGLTANDTILLKGIQAESLVATATGYDMGTRFFSESGGEQGSHALAVFGKASDTIGTAGDKDWFQISLTKGQDMRFVLEAAGSAQGTLQDGRISIYDAAGNLIASDNDSGSGADALARFVVPATGTYYAVVESNAAGGIGNYQLLATYYNVVVDTGSHVLTGTDAADTIIGGRYDDVLTGGKGSDTFIFGPGGGRDTITDVGIGTDVIDISAYKSAGYTPTLTASGSDTVIGFTNGDTIRLSNVAASDLNTIWVGYSWDGVKKPELISATSATLADTQTILTLTGSAAAAGTGNALANTLNGNDGANVLSGLAGNDLLIGGKGNDVLTGGTGADTFRFAPGSGQDIVTDFAANGDADRIDISAYFTAGQATTLTNVGNDVRIGFASGDLVLLTGIQAESLVATATGFDMGARFFSEAGGEQPNHALALSGRAGSALDTPGDKDWFALSLIGGQDVRVLLEGASTGLGTLPDGKISIYSAAGVLIATDSDSGAGADALVRFTAPNTGTYYAVIESDQAGGTGSYVVEATTGSVVAGDGTLVGSAAGDLIIGGRGDDMLTGGAGADTFRFAPGGSNDTITDFAAGGDADHIDIAAYFANGLTATLANIGNDVRIAVAGGDSILLKGIQAESLVATATGYDMGVRFFSEAGGEQASHALSLWGRAFDVLDGAGDKDWFALSLAAGQDVRLLVEAAGTGLGTLADAQVSIYDATGTLVAGDADSGAGADAFVRFTTAAAGTYYAVVESGLAGGAGTYLLEVTTANVVTGDGTLIGGVSDDLMIGGRRDDVLTGGAGADTFRFATGNGHDVISDFAANGDIDHIDISSYLATGQAATLTNIGNDVRIGFASGDSIVLTGIQAESLVATAIGYDMGARFFSDSGGEQANHALALSGKVTDTLGTPGDKDWFALSLTAGQDVRVMVAGAGTGVGTLPDGKVSIYDAVGSLIAVDSDSGAGADALARFTAAASGTYYAVVESDVAGGAGSYQIEATTANVVAGDGALAGSSADDILVGGKGADTLTGGTGSDTFRFASGSGKDVITDFAANGDADHIDISAYLANGTRPTLSNVGNDVRIGLTANDTILLKGIQAESLVATATGYDMGTRFFSESGGEQGSHALAVFGKASDTIGTAGDKDWFQISLTKGQDMRFVLQAAGSAMGTLADGKISIYDTAGNLIAGDNDAGSGADALARFVVPTTGTYYAVVESNLPGGTGSYQLYATYYNVVVDTGSHLLAGTDASDNLIGGRFDDVLTGGKGSDTFIYGPGSGHDTITDLGNGTDVIDISAYKSAGFAPTLTASGADTLISFTNGDNIRVKGVAPGYLAPIWVGYNWDGVKPKAIGATSNAEADNGAGFDGFQLIDRGGGTTAEPTALSSIGTSIVASVATNGLAALHGDFIGDGHSDILFRNVSGAVSTWNVSGDGKQVQQSAFNASVDPSWKIAETFDWNGDARSDILFRNDNGAVAIWNAQGAGFNQASYYHAPVGNDWRIAGAGDLTGDGKDDLLWQNANGSISAWTSTGTGFAESTYNHGSPGGGWMVQGLGDFTGDGKADILWRNTGGGVAMWSNNGAGTSFNEGAFFTNSISTSWHIDGIGDFNGDGRDDMLWRNDNGALSVWRSNGSGFDQGVYNANVSTDWHIDQIGDLNGDGKADIVWRNDNGAVSTWQSNGAGFDQSVYNSSAPTSWAIEAHDFLV